MREVRALVKGWEDSARTRRFLDWDQIARDPLLLLGMVPTQARGGRRLFGRGAAQPSTPEERFAEGQRRERGATGVSESRLEEAAVARLHLADVVTVGRALEHGAQQHDRLRSISPSTRADLLGQILSELEGMADELVRLGTQEGRTRKGMTWEIERIRAYLAPDVLESMGSRLGKHKFPDGTRLFVEGLGTVAAMVPAQAAPSRTALSLGVSLMTGNFTLLVLPEEAPMTSMLVVEVAHRVLADRRVDALSAVVPDGRVELLGILAESPRVDGLVLFEQGEPELEAASAASALGKVVVTAWSTSDVAIVWDGVNTDAAAKEIVRSRFTDSGRLPSCIGRVLVQHDCHEAVVKALETEIHRLRVGLPSDPTTDVGPLCRLASVELIEELVGEARELGARVVHGGERVNWRSESDPLGLYFQPTLLSGCDPGMRVMREVLPGPVLPICEVMDEGGARTLSCQPRRPGRVWVWATARADRDRLVDGLRAPGIVFFGQPAGGFVRAVDLSDAWGALELAERLSYKSWRGPVGQ